jgi:hypothetical protein
MRSIRESTPAVSEEPERKYSMYRKLPTIFVALFALLFAGAAMAAPADSPAPDAEPPAVQPVETAPAPAPAVPAPVTDGALCQTPGQGPPLERCGDVFCPPKFFCCNPLENLCVKEGQVCIL